MRKEIKKLIQRVKESKKAEAKIIAVRGPHEKFFPPTKDMRDEARNMGAYGSEEYFGGFNDQRE